MLTLLEEWEKEVSLDRNRKFSTLIRMEFSSIFQLNAFFSILAYFFFTQNAKFFKISKKKVITSKMFDQI